MDSRFVDRISGRAVPAARPRHRHRSHHPGAISEVRQLRGTRDARLRRRPQAAGRARPGACVLGSALCRRKHPDRERQFRLRVVARARAAGAPALGHPGRRRRIVFGNLLRQFRGARHAVPHRQRRATPRRCCRPSKPIRRPKSTISVGDQTVSVNGTTYQAAIPAGAREAFTGRHLGRDGLVAGRFRSGPRRREEPALRQRFLI